MTEGEQYVVGGLPRMLGLEVALAPDLPGPPDLIHRVARELRKMVWHSANAPDFRLPLGRFLSFGPRAPVRRLALGLARFLFADDDAVLYLPMEEYAEKHELSRLLGRPAGGESLGSPGELAEPVRRRPRLVVVLDRVDQAHFDVWQVLSPVLEGEPTLDGLGRAVSYKNVIFLLTAEPPSAAVPAASVGLEPGREWADQFVPPCVLRKLSDILLLHAPAPGEDR